MILPDEQKHSHIAYLTGEYPKVSHTFIQREVEALRRLALSIDTFSIRRPAPKDVLGDQLQEESRTFYVLDHCKKPIWLISSHARSILSNPSSYFKTLGLAWRLRQAGVRSALYHLFYFAEAVVLSAELKRRKIKHIHNHFGDSSCTVALLASSLSGIDYSFTEHGPNIFFEAARWRLDKKIARAKFIAAISHFCRSQLMLFSDPEHWDKISIVHCGIDPHRYAHARNAPGKYLIYVGRVEPVKGLLILLDALVVVRQSHPDVFLTVVGDGSARKKVEARATQLGLSGMIQFVGYKTQEEVAALLSEADALVLPSFAEGVPVVLMEAMASGKPVIASRVAGIQELVEDGVNGFAVPPGDATTLAKRIDQLLADPTLCNKMGREGRATVEQDFNIDHEAKILASMFKNGPGLPGRAEQTAEQA